MGKRIRRALPWAVLVLCYLLTVGVMALWGSHNINSDMSSELVLAQLLNEEGGINSANWYYSTELRTFSHVPVLQLGLRLFPQNWAAARTFSLAVLLALAAAAFIYMGRGAGLRDSAVYAAGLILLPVSEVHRYLFSLGGGYIPYVALSALMVGVVLRMPRRRHRLLRLLIAVLLCFWGGLSGVRMPMICGVPLALACAVEAFGALRRASSLREAMASEEGVSLLGACVLMAGTMAGFLVNVKVYSRMYSFDQYGETMIKQFDVSMFIEQLNRVLAFFGLNTGLPLLSPGAIVDMAMLAACALMLLALAAMLLRRDGMSVQEKLLADVTLLAVLLGMFLCGVTGMMKSFYSAGYYMFGVFLLVLLLLMFIEKRMVCRMPGVRTAAMLAVCAVFLLEGGSFVHSYMRKEQSEHEDIAAWLVENGYTKGYATFWNGNVLTELSDGVLELYTYTEWSDEELRTGLQLKSHLTQPPEGPVFVYVSDYESYTEEVPCAREDRLVHVSDFGARIYVYDSAQEVEELQRMQNQ